MKFETLPGDLKIPKIGLGTWRIGGGVAADPSQDARSLAALRSALDLGYTHFDTAEMYAHGHAEELIGQAIKKTGIVRRNLFITSKVSPQNIHYNDLLRSCEGSLRRLGTDYLDLYLIHWPSASIPLEDSFRALNTLVKDGKVRYLGVSNFDLSYLKKAQELSETPLFTNQVPYSLADRSYVKNGVLEYCQKNDILLTAYSPVGQGSMPVGGTLRQVADQHSVSPFQAALAWLVNQPRVITIPMSYNPAHQAQNLAAADLDLSADEIQQLDRSG